MYVYKYKKKYHCVLRLQTTLKILDEKNKNKMK